MNQQASPPICKHTLRVQQLFARHQQGLLAFVLTLEPRLDDAHEIVQEAFLTVSRKASDWIDGTNFFAWACTIARYTALQFRGARERRVVVLADDVIDLMASTRTRQLVDYEHRIAALADCMNRLAPRAQRLVTLRFHEGRLPEEIASIVGWSVNSVRVALTRAKAVLRDCWDRQMQSEAIP